MVKGAVLRRKVRKRSCCPAFLGLVFSLLVFSRTKQGGALIPRDLHKQPLCPLEPQQGQAQSTLCSSSTPRQALPTLR